MESTEEKVKRPKRRNSILKDVVLSENLAEEKLSEKSFLSRRSFKKRVSFADTTSIKEFLAIKDANTEWNCTYEEPVVHDSSCLSEVNKSICQPTISQNCAESFQAATNTDTQNDVESLEISKTRSKKEEVFEVSEFLMNFLGMKPQTSVVEIRENINKQRNNGISLEHMSDKDPHQLTGSRTSTTSPDIELPYQVDKSNTDFGSMKTLQNIPAIRAPELLINGEVLNRTLLDDSIIYNKDSPMESTRLGNLNYTMMNTFGMDITNCAQEQNIFKDVALMKGDISQFHIKNFGLPCSKEIDKFSSSQCNALPSVNVLQHAVTVMENDDMEMTTGVLKPFQIIIPDRDMDISNENLADQSAMTSDKLSQGQRTLITDEKVSVLCNLPEALIINETNKNVESSRRKPLIAIENMLVNGSDLQIQDVAESFKDDMDFTCKGPPLEKLLHSNLPANENQVEEALCTNKNISVTCANQQLLEDEFYNVDMEFTCKGASFKKGVHSNFPAEKCQVEETICTNENISMTSANQQLLKTKDYDDDMEFTCKVTPFKRLLHSNFPTEKHQVEETKRTNENISLTCANQPLLKAKDYEDNMEFTCKGAPFKRVLHSNFPTEHQVEETKRTNENLSLTCANQPLLKANDYDDNMEFTCKEAPFKKVLHSNFPIEKHQVEETIHTNENISMACTNQQLLKAIAYDDDMEFTCKGVPFKKVLYPCLPAEEHSIEKTIYTNENTLMTCANQQLLKDEDYSDDVEFTCKVAPLKKVLHSNFPAEKHQLEETIHTNVSISMTCADQQLFKDDDMEFTCKEAPSKKNLHSSLPVEKHQVEETMQTNEHISMTSASQQLLQAKDYDDDMEFTCKGTSFKKVLHFNFLAEKPDIKEIIHTNDNISMTCTDQQLLKDDDMEFTCKETLLKKNLHSSLSAEKHQVEETIHTNENISMTRASQQLLQTKGYDDNMVFTCKEVPFKIVLHSNFPAVKHQVEETICTNENISMTCANQQLLKDEDCNADMDFTCKGLPFKKILHPNLPAGEHHIEKTIYTNENMALIFTDPQLQKTKAYNQDTELRSSQLEATPCSLEKNFTMRLDNICKSNLNMELTHRESLELRYEEAKNNNKYQTSFMASYRDKPPTNDRLFISSKSPEGKSLSKESGSTCSETSDTMAKLTENIACTSTDEVNLTLSVAKHDPQGCEKETNLGLHSLESLQLDDLDQYTTVKESTQPIILPLSNNNEFTSRSFSQMDSENGIIFKAPLSDENIPSSSGSSTEFELQCHEKLTVFQQKNLLKSTVTSLQADPHKKSFTLDSCLDLKHPETFEPTTSIEKLRDNNFTREINVISDLTCNNFSSSKNSVFTSPVVQVNGIEIMAKCLNDVDTGGANVSSSQHDESEYSSNENGEFFNYEQSLPSSCPIPDVDENVPLHLQQTLEGLLTSPITNRQNLSMSVSLFCENLALVSSNLYSSSSVSAIKKTVAPEAKTLFGKCEEIANDLSSVHMGKYRHKRLNQSSHCDEPNAKIIAIKNFGARALPVFSSKNLSFQSCVSDSGKDSTKVMFKSVCENSSVEHNSCDQSSQLVEIASECEEEMLDDIAMELVDEGEIPFSPEKIQIDKAQLKINELLKKINEFPDFRPPYISDIVLESFSSALPDFLLPLKDVSKHLVEDWSHYNCEELQSELSDFSTQLNYRIPKFAGFNELKKNIINTGQPCSDKNLGPIINSEKFKNRCELCSLESLQERKEISTALKHKFILDGFINDCLEMQLKNRPFRIFLDLNHQNDHCTVVRAHWRPQLEDLKKSSARLAMANLGHGITTELGKLMTLTLCKAVGKLDCVVKAYEKVTNLLKEILAAQSFHITSFTNSGMTVTFVNAKAHLKVCVYIELYYDDSKDSSFPIIKATPKVIVGNLREKVLELEISRVPEGPNKLSGIVKALASFVQQIAPQRL